MQYDRFISNSPWPYTAMSKFFLAGPKGSRVDNLAGNFQAVQPSTALCLTVSPSFVKISWGFMPAILRSF